MALVAVGTITERNLVIFHVKEVVEETVVRRKLYSSREKTIIFFVFLDLSVIHYYYICINNYVAYFREGL